VDTRGVENLMRPEIADPGESFLIREDRPDGSTGVTEHRKLLLREGR
jgi:hypothetical protein